MRSQIKLPKLGDTANEVLVVAWHESVGSTVDEGDPLLSVQTDKIDIEVPSPLSGVLIEQRVQPEDEISVGTVIAVFEV